MITIGTTNEWRILITIASDTGEAGQAVSITYGHARMIASQLTMIADYMEHECKLQACIGEKTK